MKFFFLTEIMNDVIKKVKKKGEWKVRSSHFLKSLDLIESGDQCVRSVCEVRQPECSTLNIGETNLNYT